MRHKDLNDIFRRDTLSNLMKDILKQILKKYKKKEIQMGHVTPGPNVHLHTMILLRRKKYRQTSKIIIIYYLYTCINSIQAVKND